MTIRFELSKKQDENRKNQILVRISVSRNFRVGGKTRLYVSPKDWNDKTNSVRKVSKIEVWISSKNSQDFVKNSQNLKSILKRRLLANKNWIV